MSDLSSLSDQQLMALAQSQGGLAPVQPVQVQPLAPLQGSKADPTYNLDLSHLTPEQLQQLQANGNPQMSPGEDIGRSSVTGLERGVTNTLGAVGNLENLWGNGVDYLGKKAIGGLQSFTGSNLGAPDMRNGQNDPGSMNYAHFNGHTTGADYDAVAQRLLGPYHAPQTTGGRYAERIMEFAPGAVMGGGGALARAAGVVVPATASQGAEDLAPDQYKPAAGLIGALLGGGAVGAGQRILNAPEASFGAAAGQLSDVQIQQAQALRQSAAQRGLNLTLPEAVQQVTNNGTGLGRLQRVVESTKQGQALTAPYFADRAGQVSNATRSLADAIAPATDQPSMIGRNAQQAAQGSLDRVRVAINDLAKPHYDSMAGEMVPVASSLGNPTSRYMSAEGTTLPFDRYQPLSRNAAYAQALDEVRGDRLLNAGISHLPDHDVSVVNEVVKQLDRNAEASRQTVMNPSGNNARAGLFQSARNQANELASEVSPQWRAARETVAGGRSVLLDPLESGPLGKIAATDAIPAQTAALYPGIPPEGAPAETSAAVRVLGNTAPGVAEDLTRQHIVNHLNESLSQLQGGQNQYAGAKLAVALAGNPEQAATLNAGLSSLPNGAQHAANMDDLLEALRATGKRQQPGSMTAFNESDLKDLHIAPYAQAISRIGDPLTWGAGIGDVLNQANYRRNVARLADMIMASPEATAETLTSARGARMRGNATMAPIAIQASSTGNRP